MFQTLTLHNIGPHQSVTFPLSPMGDTLIQGRSGTGKSTITAAIAALLWGDPMNQAENGGDPEIEATTAKGSVFTRAKGRYGYAPAGQPAQNFTTHASYAQIVGPYAKKADVGRYILTPHAADDLYTRNRGRDFRDILTAALGADDTDLIVRELMGDQHRDSDPTDLQGALALQTTANRTKAETEGVARAADAALIRARHELERVIVPSEAAVAAARETVTMAELWTSYDREAERYVTATHARDRAIAQAADYDARLAALGARPEMPDTLAARVKVTNAERAVAEARYAVAEAERLERARADAEQRAAQPPPVAPQAAPASLFAPLAPRPVDVPVKIKNYGDHVITFDGQSAVRFDGRTISK